ncbi:hypothetical protein [Agrobacterium tumefaciens]|uniref:hypothetical protein n=1 Tax=Agrobacterium tumefaciens TaxID=358 RepID=UPI001572316B|nr:hypothetical protein [Agrobacterium tumefaciens]
MIARAAALALFAVLPTVAFAAEGESIDKAFNSTWTIPCVGPNQCTLRIFDHPTAGKKFAAFRVGSYDVANDTKCGFVFPVVLNEDGQLYTATKDFVLTITHRERAINVAGIPDSLCGLPIAGDYTELGD